MTDDKTINMILLGAPGAGKGTQAALLIKKYNKLHISTGDMLREAVKEGSDTGRAIQEYMEKGELVPDEIVTRGVIDRMSKPDASNGVILDGFPRTRAQAEALDSALSEEGKTLDVVLYLKTSEEVAVKRLSGRRVCTSCGKNYHVTNMPPEIEGICDKCKSELYQRKDDNPETIKNRFDVYQNSTKDLISYYNEKGLLRELNGNLEAEKLFEDISALFINEGLVNDDSD